MENSKFNSWYNRITEAVNTPDPVASTETEVETKPAGSAGPEVDSSSPSFSREEIISDIDTIMTQLSQLGSQVQEELDNDDVFDVNEAGDDSTMSKIKDFLFAPKYRSMQKKVNKMKLNSLDIKIAADNLGTGADKPKKDMLNTKKETLDNQIDNLQKAIDDKAKERGSYVQKVLSTEKIKGQMDLVKRASGQEDDPAKKKDLATSMAELQKRFAEEQEAVKDLSDEAKAKKAEADKKAKEEAEKKKAKTAADKKAKEEAAKKEEDTKKAKEEEDAKKAKETSAEKEKPEDKPAEKPEDKKEEKPEEPADKDAATEKSIDSYKKNIDTERQTIEKLRTEIKKLKDEQKKSTDPDSFDDKISKLNTQISQSNDDIKEMQIEVKKLQSKLSKKESLAYEAKELGLNEMAAEIESKLEWQFENNSALARKYEVEIAKVKAIKTLNESKYTNLSVADKFRALLG